MIFRSTWVSLKVSFITIHNVINSGDNNKTSSVALRFLNFCDFVSKLCFITGSAMFLSEYFREF